MHAPARVLISIPNPSTCRAMRIVTAAAAPATEVRSFGCKNLSRFGIVRILDSEDFQSFFETPSSLFLLYRLHSSYIRTQPSRLLMRETILECKLFGDSLPVSTTWLVRSLTTILSARYRKRHADQDRIYDLEGSIVPASSIIVAKYWRRACVMNHVANRRAALMMPGADLRKTPSQ